MKKIRFGKGQALKMTISAVILCFLALGPISSVYGQNAVQARVETSGPAIVSTDELTVRVNPGPVPHFWYWPTDGSQDEAYHVKFQHLIEYIDSNDDGLFTSNETASGGASFSLSSGKWEFSGFTTEDGDPIESGETADTVKFSYTLVGPIRGKQQGQNGQQGSPSATKIASENLVVVLTCHISADDGNKLKIDVYIENWNFASEDNRLAVRTDFTTDNGSHTIETHDNGYQIGDAFFAYESTAVADGQSVTVTANAEETEQAIGLKVWFNYPSFTDTLDHDPTIGIGDLSAETGGLGGFCLGTTAIIVIPLAALFAVAVRRRH
ncbi:MAG: hypothetical protein ACFFCD_17745 [Promethearchaeota archaeon]